MILILICILILQEDILKWMLTENCMEVLLSTELNLTDVSYRVQAGLKSRPTVSSVSVVELKGSQNASPIV